MVDKRIVSIFATALYLIYLVSTRDSRSWERGCQLCGFLHRFPLCAVYISLTVYGFRVISPVFHDEAFVLKTKEY